MKFYQIHLTLKKIYNLLPRFFLINKLIFSFFKILIYSRKEVVNYSDNDSAIFIGNSKDKHIFSNSANTIRAVSNFLIMDINFFNSVSPTHYFIIDPLFFNSREDRFNKFWNKINNIHQKLILVVPTLYFRKAKNIISNPLVEVNSICLTPIDGPKSIIYFLTKLGLGSFKIKNVLGAFLLFCYKQKIKKINLFGVNHDWSKYMFLDEKLQLCLSNESHKNSLISSGEKWKKNSNEIWKVSDVLKSLHEIFLFYDFYEDFFKKNNMEIINNSKDSLIQNFKKTRKFN